MTDTTEKMAADIAMTLNGGEWSDGKWYSEDHRKAWIVAVKPHADKIDTLREALQGAKTIINLLCQGFEVEPGNVVINVTSENEDGEEVFVKSISGQDVLNAIRAALEEKE